MSSLPPAPSADPSAVPMLAVRGLACERGSRRLFSGVDLDVRPGEVVWLRGRNGRGKTSLLRLVAGIAAPQSGQITFDALALVNTSESTSARRRVVYIGHANALKDDLTVGEALAFLLRIHGRAFDAATLANALARWDMQAQRHALIRTLSQGQRRRVALARLAVDALAPDAALWVLDEPFDALDASGVARLNELLAEHLKRGGSVLVTGHQSALDPALAQRDFDLDRCAA